MVLTARLKPCPFKTPPKALPFHNAATAVPFQNADAIESSRAFSAPRVCGAHPFANGAKRMGQPLVYRSESRLPQGLKPLVVYGFDGTAEAVPCHNAAEAVNFKTPLRLCPSTNDGWVLVPGVLSHLEWQLEYTHAPRRFVVHHEADIVAARFQLNRVIEHETLFADLVESCLRQLGIRTE